MGNNGNEVVLKIAFINGQVRVEGPIKNEPFCFWLLEKAKDSIKAFNTQSNYIQPATPNDMPKGPELVK